MIIQEPSVPKKMTIRCKGCGNFGLMKTKEPQEKSEDGRIIVRFICLCSKPEVDWNNPFPLD